MSAVSERPAVVIYFSDHGENVYDGGDFIGRDELHVEVPFLVYPNKQYIGYFLATPREPRV